MKKKKEKIHYSRIIHHIWQNVRSHRWPALLSFLGFGFGHFLVAIYIPTYYRDIIDLITVTGLDRVELRGPLMAWILGFGLIMVLFNIGFRVSDYAITYAQSRILRDMYDYTFRRYLIHSRRFFSNNFAGSLVAKAKRFVSALETMYDQLIWGFWPLLITLPGAFVVLFGSNRIIGWFFLVWSILYILMSVWLVKYRIKYDLAEANADSRVTAQLADVITNVFEVKIFSSAKREQTNFAEVTQDQHERRSRAWNFLNLQSLIQAIFMGILEIGAMWIALEFWIDGNMTIGDIALLQVYFAIIFRQLWNLSKTMGRFAKALTNANEIVEILDAPLDVIDPEQPEELVMQAGHVVFDNITFAYKDGFTVFKDFSLDIKPGEKIGLVGHSGSGKTTLTNLLIRFFDVQRGTITIDGQNVQAVTQDDLRSVISFVPQDPLLFHRSIIDNIRYGKPKATKAQVTEAAKAARSHEFISEFKDGYKTLVGERGVKLSGGQRQRIAIARAMLEDAPILVLDEATSSLDSISEQYIKDAFEAAMKDKTTIVIAHRLSTIQQMDRIVVLDKGVIVEMGTHDELLVKKGYYYDLWSHQQGGFIS